MINLTDAITHCKEKAKELRKKAIDDYANDKTTLAEFADCRECAGEYEQLASWLIELQERREADRWIPVSERLPEKDKNVLVTDNEVSEVYMTFYIGDGLWCCDDGVYEHRITHWKPLPKPYNDDTGSGGV